MRGSNRNYLYQFYELPFIRSAIRSKGVNRGVNYYVLGGIIFFLIVVFPGCCPKPFIKYNDQAPPGIFLPIAAQSTIDGRARFREILCAVTDARKGQYPDERPCAGVLHNLDEPKSTATSPFISDAHNRLIKVVIVTGLFGECIADYLLPFSDGRYFEGYQPQRSGFDYLKNLGYEVEVIVTGGRASTEANGQLVRQRLQEISSATKRKIVIVAYSKGTTDVLHVLTLFKEDVPQNIRALVSVAGVVAGTPLADEFAGVYNSLFKAIPWSTCPPADGGGFMSMSRNEQFTWLSRHQHEISKSVKYYSLPAFTSSERINVFLKPFYTLLSQLDPRNDGQVLIQDAILPGGTILGYANADHWAVSIGFNRAEYPTWRRAVNHNSFPREVLLESILQYVAQDI